MHHCIMSRFIRSNRLWPFARQKYMTLYVCCGISNIPVPLFITLMYCLQDCSKPQTWFIRYISYCNIPFLDNVIINKTKVLLPQAKVTLADFGYPVQAIWFYFSQIFNYLAFRSFDFKHT